jgi:hypothetical protein
MRITVKNELNELLRPNSKAMLFLYNGLFEKVIAGIKTPMSRQEAIQQLKDRPETKVFMFVADLRRWSWDMLNFQGTAPEKSVPSELKGYNVQVNITDSEETIQLLMDIKIGISISSFTNNY